MDNFDAIVTDPRLSLGVVNAHVEHLTSDSYLLEEYHVACSSGSSGRRGLFVYNWDEWSTFVALESRLELVRQASHDGPEGTPTVTAFLFGDSAAHVSGALQDFTDTSRRPVYRFPMTLPRDEMIDGLNRTQPTVVMGYPSAVDVLVAESRTGRLRISPIEVRTCGEYLEEATRSAVRDVWGTEIDDYWGVAEGVYAFACGVDHRMHLPDDVVIIEPVDSDGRCVPYGAPAEKILLTRLYNSTQPLIRYEIPDAMTMYGPGCPCGCSHRQIGEITGWSAGLFAYRGGPTVHWLALMNPLGHDQHVLEYQVLQTETGVDVRVLTDGALDIDAIRRKLKEALALAGLRDPEVALTEVPTIARLPSGKLRQFISLAKV